MHIFFSFCTAKVGDAGYMRENTVRFLKLLYTSAWNVEIALKTKLRP